MPAGIYSSATVDTALAAVARSTSGSSAPMPGYGGANTLRCQLDVTAAAGTTPTLDVLVQDTIDGTNFYTVGTFARKTAAGREAINVTTPFTDTLRVSWTVTGVAPSFTFSVSIYSE